MTDTPRSIDKDFVVLSPEKEATVEPFDPGLYQRLDRNYDNFRGHELISCHEFSQDWGMWEVHPNGDEIVILLKGEVTFVLQLDEGEKSVCLDREGAYVIVPRNVWHTARTTVASKLLFITPGEGTQHRDG